jgi:hypothetical protein
MAGEGEAGSEVWAVEAAMDCRLRTGGVAQGVDMAWVGAMVIVEGV